MLIKYYSYTEDYWGGQAVIDGHPLLCGEGYDFVLHIGISILKYQHMKLRHVQSSLEISDPSMTRQL